MRNSLVPAAAAAHPKQLVRNKKLIKRADDQKPAQDEQQAADQADDTAHATQAKHADQPTSMSDTSLSADFSFSGAMAAAAGSASLAGETALQDDGSVAGDDDDAGGAGTVLLVGAVALAGLGAAVALGGGGNKNDAPSITSGATGTVAENAATSTVIYQVNATDPDGDPLTYTLSGADAALLNISPTGAVTLKSSANFEAKNSYAFTVTASDGELSTSQNVTVGVTNVNEGPTVTSGTTATVAENAPATTVVYQATATDPENGTLTYTLSGADAALFNISSTGAVTLKNPADFETKSSYAFTVNASDGTTTASQPVTLTVTNVVEGPTFTSAGTATVAENVPTTTVVYDANVSGSAATTFALTGADAAAFTIDPATGEVRFKASPNFEADSSYAFTVTATDANGTTSQNVALTVTDVAVEGPTFQSGTTVSYAENRPVSDVVYDANATGTGTVTYSLTGADAAAFTVNATTGEVRFKASPDFETDASYTLGVVATDSNGATTQNVAVTITDIDEPDVTEISLDVGNPASQTPVEIDAGVGAVVLVDDADVNSNVVILDFTEDDIIEVVGVDDFDDYSFTTGTGAEGVDDLIITQQNPQLGTANIILIEDVLVNEGFVLDYETAAAAVGFDFMQLG